MEISALKSPSQKAQDIQDAIFQRMTVEKKIKLASDFFRFMQQLNKLGKNHGTSKTASKNRRNSR